MNHIFILVAVVFLGNSYALASPSATTTQPPIVLSYALQPVINFNQLLIQAQLRHENWAQKPADISQHYTKATKSDFQLIKATKKYNKVITYNISKSSATQPEILLILTLNKQRHWFIETAKFSWRCPSSDYFSTNKCEANMTN